MVDALASDSALGTGLHLTAIRDVFVSTNRLRLPTSAGIGDYYGQKEGGVVPISHRPRLDGYDMMDTHYARLCDGARLGAMLIG